MATNPTLLSQPIAANGAKNVIPNTTSTAGAMSQDQGFPAETALPLGAGGVAPSREDFNGAFNLLSGLLFYAQKGWQFEFDETQDYFAGCIVRDTLDDKLYEAINDVSASSTHPSTDSTNWKLGTDMSAYTTTVNAPMFNKRDIITTSGTYTAPVTGWYKVTVKGGGGGGGYVSGTTTQYAGYGGGEGGTSIRYKHYTAGDVLTVVIGAGGTGGTTATNGFAGDGGDSSFDGIVAGGGHGGGAGNGISTQAGECNRGGSGDIVGASGGNGISMSTFGGNGGGTGGGTAVNLDAIDYGGGGGGGSPFFSGSGAVSPINKGGAGYQGVVYVEYYDSSLNP